MLVMIILGGAFFAFLALFWLTPIGVPTLKHLGGGQMSPDLTFGYGPEETYRLLDRYGPGGISHWRGMLLLDMVFAGVYAAFFALLAMAWARRVGAGSPWQAVAVVCPILAGVSDYIENVLLLGVLRALPQRRPAAVSGASLFTRAKFTFSYATLAVPLVYWGATRLGWSG